MTSAAYTQAFNYDPNDRLVTGPMGSYTYSASPLHAVTSTSNGYTAQYDAAGDMTCKAPDSTTTCAGSNPTGQTMGYDALRDDAALGALELVAAGAPAARRARGVSSNLSAD